MWQLWACLLAFPDGLGKGTSYSRIELWRTKWQATICYQCSKENGHIIFSYRDGHEIPFCHRFKNPPLRRKIEQCQFNNYGNNGFLLSARFVFPLCRWETFKGCYLLTQEPRVSDRIQASSLGLLYPSSRLPSHDLHLKCAGSFFSLATGLISRWCFSQWVCTNVQVITIYSIPAEAGTKAHWSQVF